MNFYTVIVIQDSPLGGACTGLRIVSAEDWEAAAKKAVQDYCIDNGIRDDVEKVRAIYVFEGTCVPVNLGGQYETGGDNAGP